MKKAIVMMMLLSLSGCVPFYMPPSNGEVATLTVPVIRLKWGSGGATLIGVAGDNGCGKLQRIRKEKNKEETSLKVPSDRAIFISFMQQYSDRICGVSGWASLEAGENYEAGFNFESRNRCFFFIRKISSEGEAQTFVKLHPLHGGGMWRPTYCQSEEDWTRFKSEPQNNQGS